MNKLDILQRDGSIITSEKGNSMLPIIKSGQKHRLNLVNQNTTIRIGDIVYCKVKGNFYTHLVKAIHPDKGYLIGNNKGGINGWTKTIYGKVVEIFHN